MSTPVMRSQRSFPSSGHHRRRLSLWQVATRTILLLLAASMITGFGGMSCRGKNMMPSCLPFIDEIVRAVGEHSLTKEHIQAMIPSELWTNLRQRSFDISLEDKSFSVETTIDPTLQAYLLDNLRTEYTRYIGIVVMDPTSGEILSMVSHDARHPERNVCVESEFPAASIFKIVTAAAGIEMCGLDSDSRLTFNGGKHTLYRYQIRDSRNKWSNRISLRDSFAQSVNPVFGKIGAKFLGSSALGHYADFFGFNEPIRCEMPVEKSTLSLSDDPYHLAEIASGFNKNTKISPLHGALMASTISNRGSMVEPTLVKRIVDERGVEVYRSEHTNRNVAISPETAGVMKQLMRETIDSGTCRKMFARYQRDKILGQLDIGGKTGSIGTGDTDYKYDWFVGFADEKYGSQKIVISIVVAHDQFLGRRAGNYARMAIKSYFNQYFSEVQSARNTHEDSKTVNG